MKQTLTIVSVKKEPRLFNFGDGKPGASAEVTFETEDGYGKDGSVASNPDNVQKHIDALLALKGKPSEFEVEEGQYGLKIKDYPGKPAGRGGGGGYRGGGGSRPDWTYEDFAERVFKQDRITVCSAFKTAADLATGAGIKPENLLDFILDAGPKLYERMCDIVPAPAPRPTPAPAPAPKSDGQPEGEAGGAVATSDELRTMRGRVLEAYEGKVPAVAAAFLELTGEEKKFADLTVGDLANLLAAQA